MNKHEKNSVNASKRRLRVDRLALVVLVLALIGAGTAKLANWAFSSFVNYLVESSQRTIDENPWLQAYQGKELKVEAVSATKNIEETKPNETSLAPKRVYEEIDLGQFTLTGYCNCEECCGQWAGGPCYNGEMPEENWTVAVDPDIIPIGSLLLINNHIYKAQDTGSAIKGNHIDVYCASHDACFDECINTTTKVTLLKELGA